MTDDLSRQDATSPDEEYTLTIKDAGALYKQAGFPRTPRTIQRYCKGGHLVSRDADTRFGKEQYLITPASVATHIAYLKEVNPAPTGRDTSRQDAIDVVGQNKDDDRRHGTATEPDLSRPVATEKVEESRDENERQPHATERDTSRRVATDLDIFEHPYVKRLESEVEKWQGKFEAQVQRTQEVLVSSNKNLMELQRATTVANSKTLADYLLKAGRFLKSPFADDEEGKEPEAGQIDGRG
jgi:hypothetical protein